MPNFYLKEPIRKSLVAYLSSLKGESYADGRAPWDDPALKEDLVKKGQIIFTHAGCVGCHGVAGSGGQPNNNVPGGLIPSLIKASDGYSKEELAAKILSGVPQSSPEDPTAPPPMIHMPAWSEKLSKEEVEALVEYIYSLNPHKAEVW
jgi:mono/diheme cytochrome c family protein